jgi:uncharacterized membrane protein YraQ (UPF0718 family)
MDYYLAGGSLRFFQVIIYASLWIVIGCFIAAIFRRMLGPKKVRKLFADGTRWGLVTGWAVGMLLPVCSLGVIPIVRELHRAGVKKGTILAFGLTAPLFNPMSVLYGLTLSDPIAILSFSFCALIIVSLLGMIWNWRSDEEIVLVDEPLPSPGIKRSLSVFHTASRELVGPSLGYIAIGIVGSIALAILLPKGFLQNQVERDNLLAPVIVGLVATPIYSTPLLAMSQIGGMFQHGNSIGAAFSLLILGAGTNIGLFMWFGATYGLRRVILFFLLLFATTVGLAYLIGEPLYPKGIDEAGHSHAFDVYSHPFDAFEPNLMVRAKGEIADFWQANEFGGTYLMAGLIILGCGVLILEKSVDLESWFTAKDESKSSMNIEVPAWVLGLTIVVGLVAASVMGCYLYYPAPDDLLGDLRAVNAEAVLCARNEEWDAANKWIGFSDDLSRRLEVGVFLRKGKVGEFQTTKAQLYRNKLDDLKLAVDSKDATNIKELSMDVSNAYSRMSSAFLTSRPK